jgi:hypothetical protein
MELEIKTAQVKILEDFFNDLSAADQKKIFVSGFRKAARPLVRELKNVVPYRTGRLQRSIGSIENPNDISILIGAKLSGSSRNKGWHGHFTENGTKERFRRTKKNASTGSTPGVHWFENAYDAKEDQIFDNIEAAWHEAIDNFITRTNKKLNK